jgi:hypothetical protein
LLLKFHLSLTAVAVLFLPLIAFAASPPSGDLPSNQSEASWGGGPFVASNPATTAGLIKQGPCEPGQPACDNYRLTVTGSGIKQVLIAIAPGAGFETDDYDLYVYNDQGVIIASDATEDGFESVVVDPNTSSFFDVRVQPYLVGVGSTYSGVAQPVRGQAIDVERECFEALPENIEALDLGQEIELSVMLLLDGTDPAVAEKVMARAAESYRPLNVKLTLKKMKEVSYTTTVSNELIAAAKQTMGGIPPRGIDLVGVFTNKGMQSATGGAGTVVGQADCIGGVRWSDTSFFVVSDISDIENPTTGQTGTLNSLGLNPNVDATAEVMAHEIGHLMGAHHHYSNCVEGNLSSAGPGDLSPCTLMHPMVNFASLNFSFFSGSVTRGHAVSHAAP